MRELAVVDRINAALRPVRYIAHDWVGVGVSRLGTSEAVALGVLCKNLI